MKRSKETAPPAGLDPKEVARREAVKKELAQGRVTLVATDLASAPPRRSASSASSRTAAELIEKLYAKQEGTLDLAAKIPADDTASTSMFFRNQGPKCEAPQTQNDPACSAIPDAPKGKLSGLYPGRAARQPEVLRRPHEARGGKKEKVLMDPFTVVTPTATGGRRKPTKTPSRRCRTTRSSRRTSTAVSGQLKAAAEALGEKEPALKAYLLAAAQAFTDDKWWPADEAWAKMDAKNSKYYLRIAPDEVYHEPCSTKALYHVSFGLINQGSLKWQSKLDPLKTDMEKALAELAGPSVQGARGELQAAGLHRHRAQRR